MVALIHWILDEDFTDLDIPLEGLDLEPLLEEVFALLTSLAGSIQQCRKGLVDRRLRGDPTEDKLITTEDVKNMEKMDKLVDKFRRSVTRPFGKGHGRRFHPFQYKGGKAWGKCGKGKGAGRGPPRFLFRPIQHNAKPESS